jgi:hypothetical protein
MARKQIYSPVHILNKNKIPDESSIYVHCHKRIRVMITLGLLVRKIVEKKRLSEVIISFDGAKIQDGRGAQQIRTEAAHNIPRNVLVNGRSTWEYIDDPECGFHERIKKQIYLISAATVIVEKEINYIDSQWERNGILDVFLNYLYECIRVEIDTENEMESLLEAGKKFIDGCKETLRKTQTLMREREVYRQKKETLDKIFERYNYMIENFNYGRAIESLLGVYRLPQYK